jgi:hypothetical protein
MTYKFKTNILKNSYRREVNNILTTEKKECNTYNVAICRNPILNGISPVNWLYDKSLA